MDQYRRIAPLYDPLVGPALRPVHRAMVEALRPLGPARLLDLCCGTGLLSGQAAQAGIRTLGVDLSGDMLDVARRRRPEAEYLLADATALPLPDQAFDAAVISFALHEKPETTARSILAEARRVVRRGGRILVADYKTPGRGLLAGAAIRIVERLAGREHHDCFRRYMEAGGAVSLLSGAGLTGRCVQSFLSGWVGLYSVG